MFGNIRYKILGVVGFGVTVGLIGTAAFYARYQEQTLLEQNQRTMHKLAETVLEGLQSVMLAGYADVAQSFADQIKRVPEVSDFRIMRVDGTEAFRDNATIESVNKRRGEELFLPRDREVVVPIIPAGDTRLAQVLRDLKPVTYESTDLQGRRTLTFLQAIPNREPCHKCHGGANAVRGLIKVTTSMAPVENAILRTRQQSIVVLAATLMGIMLLTGYMLGRAVVAPIQRVTSAMAWAAAGNLGQKVPVLSGDELGRMAESFNVMTDQLRKTYDGLKHEQNKLATIILSAGEGIVVTDEEGNVVLVNPAAETLLGKRVAHMVAGGFESLFDDPDKMRGLLSRPESAMETIVYKDRVLSIGASTIRNPAGEVIGSAALIRDITEQTRLEQELRRLSTVDGLTGLYNRRHLDDVLAAEMSRSARYRQTLSVIMSDIDHFKRFNDEHGHETGDRVLREVATTLRGGLRNHDIPCRYGGEEFMLILPNTGREGACAVAERLREDVEALDVGGLKVTISLGVATFPEVEARSADELAEAADKALYEAKRAGRNRVRFAEPADAPAQAISAG